jgi:hypothetical protein
LKGIFFFLWIFSFSSYAQIELVPIYRDSPSGKQNKLARTASLPALPLPFWDDFSFHLSKKYYPNDTLWEDSESVWVNSGMGIHPPSLNVATFDGYDYLGKPYSTTDLLAKGTADKLTSRALKLGDALAFKPSVFISFFYQFTGNGDRPELGDILSLLFKDGTNQWKQVWQVENNGTLKPDEFVQVILPISDNVYFHNDFQFRFQNFGRLSGPYDTWNVDYVYVSSGKQQYDPAYKDFPDRVIVGPLTSLFGNYTSMPVKHFFSDSAHVLTPPTLVLNNRRADQNTIVGQPVGFASKATIFSKKMGTVSMVLEDSLSKNAKPVVFNTTTLVPLNVLPDLSIYKSETDSLAIVLDIKLNSGDNDKKRKEIALDSLGNVILDAFGNPKKKDKGDYDTIVYKGIDFRHNDVVRDTFSISSYYAYDDGVAEYGAKITGSGTQLAYQFDMKTTQRDTIVAVDLYFPRFGDESNQTVQLQIMNALTTNEPDYKQIITIQRNNRNVFWRVPIPIGVPVQGKFYVGWKLNSSAVIPIGLDHNTDSGDKMFVNATGTWEQNTTLKGSLMMRPVFGKPQDPTTRTTDVEAARPYPNPTKGTFFLPAAAQQIQLYDLAGRAVIFEWTDQFDKKEIVIDNPATGLYLVRYFDRAWRTEKIMVRP